MAVYDESRYIQTPVIKRNNTEMLAIRNRFSFNIDNASVYTWTDGDTLDGVSYTFYDTPDFRWAILDANPKYRTEFDIKPGDSIYIPDYDEVVEIVDV